MSQQLALDDFPIASPVFVALNPRAPTVLRNLAADSAPAVPGRNEAAASPEGQRFKFVDALRAAAVMGVMACHFKPPFASFPRSLAWCAEQGALTVYAFFVISGFVVAYSVRNARISPAYFFNFAWRRSVRLDPPYWVTLALIAAIGWAHQTYGLPTFYCRVPTWPALWAHLVYMPNVFGFKDMCVVFWTLRLEIMFYAIFIVLLGVAVRLPLKRRSASDREALTTARVLLVFGPIALVSIIGMTYGRFPGVVRYFHMFQFGAVAWWTLDRRLPTWVFQTLAVAMLASIAVHWNPQTAVALATGLSIVIAGRKNALARWGNVRPLQYVGKLSYSLYLLHVPIGQTILDCGYAWTGESIVTATLWIPLACLGSLVAAQALYTLVEAPSVRWSKRFRPGSRPAPAASGAGLLQVA